MLGESWKDLFVLEKVDFVPYFRSRTNVMNAALGFR
jgi:hypothetical protein